MSRQRASSGSPYEPRLGISRAVRSGRIIAVAGTAPIGPDGKTVGIGDAAAQARRCIEIVRNALYTTYTDRRLGERGPGTWRILCRNPACEHCNASYTLHRP